MTGPSRLPHILTFDVFPYLKSHPARSQRMSLEIDLRPNKEAFFE
jgi:hypothetical protein